MVKENEQMRDWGWSFILLQKPLTGTEPGILHEGRFSCILKNTYLNKICASIVPKTKT